MAAPLSDREVYDLLHECLMLIRDAQAETVAGRASLEAARRNLVRLQTAMMIIEDRNSGVP